MPTVITNTTNLNQVERICPMLEECMLTKDGKKQKGAQRGKKRRGKDEEQVKGMRKNIS